ncbi:MAG: tetratricopeptide repeat protein [Burkholderiales bacterium]
MSPGMGLRLLRGAIAAVALLAASSAMAGLTEGLDALRRGDYEAAAKELKPLAERGDPEAQYRVGLMYEYGKGFPANKAEAVRWIRRAADQNHASAQTELGILYTLGEGIAKDDAQAVAWFRKAAAQGNPTAQYNLGLLIAKGTGAKFDLPQAIGWFQKAAAQGMAPAQTKIGVAYEFGEGVAKDGVLAYAAYVIAAGNGDRQAAERKDAIAAKLSSSQRAEGDALAAQWSPGKPMPTRVAAAGPVKPDTCTATGSLEGEKFSATRCAVAFFADNRSVAIWFNEDAITPEESAAFELSSYADGSKNGRPRTMLVVMFCPGGGSETASPAAVRMIDFNSSHAKSPTAGLQRVLKAPADLKVERMSGDVKPGGRVAGRMSGKVAATTFTLEFDLAVPSKEAAAGLACKG